METTYEFDTEEIILENGEFVNSEITKEDVWIKITEDVSLEKGFGLDKLLGSSRWIEGNIELSIYPFQKNVKVEQEKKQEEQVRITIANYEIMKPAVSFALCIVLGWKAEQIKKALLISPLVIGPMKKSIADRVAYSIFSYQNPIVVSIEKTNSRLEGGESF